MEGNRGDGIDLRERMEVAGEAAFQAGRVTLGYFLSRFEIETKADESPVTVADREAERRLVEILSARYPEDAILGEEHGEKPGRSGYRWVVDPIDGTKSFVRGVPLYGVLVGLEDPEGHAVVGAAAFPALGDLVVAGRGLGCWWNSRRARVSTVHRLSEACVLATGDECFRAARAEASWSAIERAAKLVRGWGDCYGHVLVATGRAEAMIDPILADWDCVALAPIVEEAGGVFTDWNGTRTVHGKSGISTNSGVAAELRELIARSRAP